MWRDHNDLSAVVDELIRSVPLTSAAGDTSRRALLNVGAADAAGVVVACFIPPRARKVLARDAAQQPAQMPLNTFLRVVSGSGVTVLLKHSEMGQGVWNSIPTVVADELDCDWSTVKVEHTPVAPQYAHTAPGLQITAGSTDATDPFAQLRYAAATARTLLIAAAAKKWNLGSTADCRSENGYVFCNGKKASYGELADAAAKLPTPMSVSLKKT